MMAGVPRLLVCLLAVSLLWPLMAVAETVHIGVLAFRPKPATLKQWQPLGGALKQAMPEHDFVIDAYTFPELQHAVSRKELDYVLTNPGHYVLLARKLGLSAPLATLVVENDGVPMKAFGGVIFCRAGRDDLNELGDIRSMRIAATATESLGGYQMQAYELSMQGLHLPRDASLLQVGMPHDNVVQAVLDGRADVGFVRSGVLEAMAREGKIDLAQFKLLNEQHGLRFPHRVSTRLYPEWAFAALTEADSNISRHIAAALFVLEENKTVTRAIGIRGFTVSSDYAPVEELLRELRLPPFEQAPKFTVQDVWARYRWQMQLALAAISLILLLTAGLLFTNRRLKAERRKLERETGLRHGLLNAMGEGVYGVDQNGQCIFINPAALSMLGFSETEVLHSNKHALFHHHYPDGEVYPEEACPIYLSLQDGMERSAEEWFWRKDGSGFPVALTVSPHRSKDGREGAVVVFHDITERKQNEERMRHLAQHDPLTGLPNRALLSDRLQQALACAKRDKLRVALVFIDLDRFKPINDTLGHVVGDWLLQQAAHRMRECVRDSDTVARVGGDEFVVLLRVIDTQDDAVMVAEKIRKAINLPFDLAQQSLQISCSIGIALYPDHAKNESEMMDFADIAMYQAKQHGRDKLQLFQPE